MTMPAPRPVIIEIEELGLSHNKPWTDKQLRVKRYMQEIKESWFLVAKGSSKLSSVGQVEQNSPIETEIVDVEDEADADDEELDAEPDRRG